MNIKGIQQSRKKTFHWSGYYETNFNQAFTKNTQLNALLEFNPQVPNSYKDDKFIFLANCDPLIQLKALSQYHNPQLIILDTMNYWINNSKKQLFDLIKKVNILILNEQEAKDLTQETSLILACQKIIQLGVSRVIIKKGEHGSLMYNSKSFFFLPAYPTTNLIDPTGAGDSFAGAFIGYLANMPAITENFYKKALIYATIISSYTIQSFSIQSLIKITQQTLDKDYQIFNTYTHWPN